MNEEASTKAVSDIDRFAKDVLGTETYLNSALRDLEKWHGESGAAAERLCRQAKTMVENLSQAFSDLSEKAASAENGMREADEQAARE